jgi:hypothetical protein
MDKLMAWLVLGLITAGLMTIAHIPWWIIFLI